MKIVRRINTIILIIFALLTVDKVGCSCVCTSSSILTDSHSTCDIDTGNRMSINAELNGTFSENGIKAKTCVNDDKTRFIAQNNGDNQPIGNEKDNKNEEKHFDYTTISMFGIFYILLAMGILALIGVSIVFVDDMRYATYIYNIHQYFDEKAESLKFLAYTKYILIGAIGACHLIHELIVPTTEDIKMVFSFSILPMFTLLIVLSRFLYDMHLANMPSILQILITTGWVIVIFIMAVFGNSLFNYQASWGIIKKNPLISGITAIITLYLIYTGLLIILPAKYAFVAKYTYCTAISTMLYGAVLGLRLLLKLIRWVEHPHVSSSAMEKHDGLTMNREDYTRLWAYISLFIGLICSVIFVFVVYFCADIIEKKSFIVVLFVIKITKKFISKFNILNILASIQTRSNSLVNVLNVISTATN
ncbi:hypothetical protein NEPAR04_0799 [Nematocida parisii]|nr:hypothetical protein NEPAR03_2276 [Nematocida parisii]KAI5131017.1 hypothetical protein NEPAR08_2311 [Nematocida parisii]KAI5141229.1 hypothetical protein NEPAR04_0799 [Nematocida parisii]